MQRSVTKLTTRAPFSTLFPIDPQVLAAVTESIQAFRFHAAEPIEVWGDVVVDGHTRLAAAIAAGLEQVPVVPLQFADERAALEYAIRRQRDRRNLTRKQLDAFVLRAVAALDTPQTHGGDRKSEKIKASDGALNGKSAAQTAAAVGVSTKTVERVRTVLEHGDAATQQAVEDGTLSVNGAYQATQERRQAPPATARSYSPSVWIALPAEERAGLLAAPSGPTSAKFNRQEGERIEWAQWSWNPVTGCDHGCPYCYARVIAERLYTGLPAGERFAPLFWPERLAAPRQTKVPAAAETDVGLRNVFVCSMADLFGKWVPQDWIDAVFAEVVAAPAWNYLFLTKFPQRLAAQRWPANAWVGTSVDTQARVATAERAFAGVEAGVKWLSCEPLLEPLHFESLAMFDWVVIGGQTANPAQNGEFTPPWAWIEDLIDQARQAGCRVYLKAEPDMRPREYPTGALVSA